MGTLSSRLVTGLALDQSSNQAFNLHPCEWTLFHWSSYERHKTETLFHVVWMRDYLPSRLAGYDDASWPTAGGNLAMTPPTHTPGFGFNDDQRGRDV
jgi:hypothetical protein